MEKKNRSSNSDMIRNIPTNLKDTILAFLTLREAVRTSILSKSWRYSWTSLPKLVFDDTMFEVMSDNQLLLRYKVISAINQVLLFHQGTILKFSFFLRLLESCPEIDHLMVFLSKSGVKEFDLGLEPGDLYKMPSSFFSCQELTRLDLSSCEFSLPPSFRGFSRLISLDFFNVIFATNLFGNFISSCPLLEKLVLYDSSRLDCSEISAPNLKILRLNGTCKSLRFKNVPLLQSASIDMDLRMEVKEISSFDEFFGYFRALENLATNHVLFWAGGVPKKLSNSSNLKFVKLSSFTFVEPTSIASLYYLIMNSPMIRRIEIEAISREDVDVAPTLAFLKTVDCSNIVLDELWEVRISKFSGVEPELEFIKLLLTKSPMLETMHIKRRLKDNGVVWKHELKKLTRFRCASPMADIIYE